MSNPEQQHAHRRDQPKQRIHQVNPNRILHPLYARIALRPLLDIHIAKQAEERDPQDEEDRVADPGEGDAGGEGDEVEQGEEGGEGGGHFCVDLFSVSTVMTKEGCGARKQVEEGAGEERQTHFPSEYLCSLSALCRSTPYKPQTVSAMIIWMRRKTECRM